MAERGAKKAAGKVAGKRSVAGRSTPRGAAAAAAPAAKARRPAAAIAPAARVAALEAERDRLAFELDTARERIRLLEERQATVVKRIDGIIDSLHNLLDE